MLPAADLCASGCRRPDGLLGAPVGGVDRRVRKLVIFTEHRDTLHYLQERITTLLGRHLQRAHLMVAWGRARLTARWTIRGERRKGEIW